MSYRMAYQITHGQQGTQNAERIVLIEVEVETPQTIEEIRETVAGFLTAVTGEREVLRQQDNAASDWTLDE